MKDLIERLEKATGPDRELDFDIAMLLNAPFGAWESFQKYDAAFPAYTRQDVAAYTSSIDAALTLVSESAGLRLERYWLRRPEPAWRACLFTGGIPGNPARQFVGEDAYTPAIALCIAALKARAATPSPPEHPEGT